MKKIFYSFALLIFLSNFITAQSVIDTIGVSDGWNLIGPLSTGEIQSIIATEPPGIIIASIFGYNPGGGYYQADSLKRGNGYWVLVNQNGKIIFLAAPQPPALLSPINAATSVSLPPTLVWDISGSATSYTLQVSTSDQFTNLVYSQSGITGTSQEISGLTYLTTYYWRVSATNSYGTSGWSEAWIFRTATGCVNTVTYAGKTYHPVQIGPQCWLRENLDVGVMIAGIENQTNNGTIEKFCYNDVPAYCDTLGGLYQWDEAMQWVQTSGTQGICPQGWHLPTFVEFQTLSTTVGGEGNSLKAVGQGTEGGAGTNTSGFSALLAGIRNNDPINNTFGGLGSLGRFHSSDNTNPLSAYYLMLWHLDNIVWISSDWKNHGYSIRCIKD